MIFSRSGTASEPDTAAEPWPLAAFPAGSGHTDTARGKTPYRGFQSAGAGHNQSGPDPGAGDLLPARSGTVEPCSSSRKGKQRATPRARPHARARAKLRQHTKRHDSPRQAATAHDRPRQHAPRYAKIQHTAPRRDSARKEKRGQTAPPGVSPPFFCSVVHGAGRLQLADTFSDIKQRVITGFQFPGRQSRDG